MQYRAFINAPGEYDWFAIDENGTGHVFKNEPELILRHYHYTGDEEEWDDNSGLGGYQVGNFSQYIKWYKDIKIKRRCYCARG